MTFLIVDARLVWVVGGGFGRSAEENLLCPGPVVAMELPELASWNGALAAAGPVISSSTSAAEARSTRPSFPALMLACRRTRSSALLMRCSPASAGSGRVSGRACLAPRRRPDPPAGARSLCLALAPLRKSVWALGVVPHVLDPAARLALHARSCSSRSSSCACSLEARHSGYRVVESRLLTDDLAREAPAIELAYDLSTCRFFSIS